MRKSIVLLFFILTACGGTMHGMVRGSGEMISINYTQSMAHDELKVTMPDGETFTGKSVMVGKSTSYGTRYGAASGTSFAVVESYTGNFQAVLFGNKGNTMRCQFHYADSSGSTTAGGIGLCETSEGEVVDVQW